MYSRKDRNEGEAIRSEALESVTNPLIREQMLEEQEIREYDESLPADSEENQKRKLEDKDEFEFGPKFARFEKQASSTITSTATSKNNMLQYLEKKSEVIFLCN